MSSDLTKKVSNTPSVLYAKNLREAGRLDWWWAGAPHFTLCRETGQPAEGGECPEHGGDACLYEFGCIAEIERAIRDELERQ